MSRDEFPVDILIDILSRVPSKSIARFRCVSKLWRSVLGSPDFTNLFLTRCPRILFTLYLKKEILYFSIPQDHPNPDEKSNCDVAATRYNTSFPEYAPLDLYSQRLTMVCGLVLGYKLPATKLPVICNPATGECITLPKFLLKDETLPKVKPRIEGFYFGYDPVEKQFKVLCMTMSKTHRVLTLENGKRLWRIIESEFDFEETYYRYPGEVCINGVLYFGTSFQQSYGIVCFDVRSEKFSLINIYKDMVHESPYSSWYSTTLINYKGKFAIHTKIEGEDDNGDLWVLEDAGNHKWSKHDHAYPASWKEILHKHGLRIIGMTSTSEMVFAPYILANPFYIFYYNFERKSFTRVNIGGLETRSGTRGDWDFGRISTFLDYGENMKLFK